MPSPPRSRVAVLDACVLYPAALRDFLMWLAAGSLYSLRLTDAIHDEWMRNALRNYPDLTAVKLERTRDLMNRIQAHALVTGYEAITPTLTLPDPDDRHVLAAAIHAGAGTIVTFNRKHFPAKALAGYGVLAKSPDAFVIELAASEARRQEVVAVARRARANLKNPPKTVEEYLGTLRQCGMTRTADLLVAHSDDL
jgi:predicted nucleic acid-binding protein